MAKVKDADEEVEGLAIDSETMEMLDGDVKKGKIRKFILICKGSQIKKLIVFKKGPYNTRIQQAKKDGFRGDAICGIVTGSGVSLTFQMAGNKEVAGAMSVDQPVDSEPTKTSKLKEFLSENNLTRKPEYEIVRDVAAVKKAEEDGDAAVARVAQAGAATSAPAASPAPASAPAPAAAAGASDANLEAQFQKVKSILQAKIAEAGAINPDAKPEMDRLMEAAQEHEKAQAFGDGLGVFKTLAQKVKDAFDLPGNSKETYEANLPGAELKVKSLKDHPQSAAIKPELDKLAGYLKEAKDHAAAGKYVDANKALAKLAAEYPAAKQAADTTKLAQEIMAKLQIKFNNFELHQGIGAIDAAKIKELKDKFPEMEVAIKGRDWNKFDATTSDFNGKLDVYKQQANRHGDYVGLRNNALMRVQALEAHPNKETIKTEIASIKTDLIDEAQKEYDTNKSYEKARALLVQVDAKFDDAKKKADTQGQTDFKKELDAAKLKVTALDTPEKNKVAAPEIAAIKAKLAKAEGYAGTNQFPEALQLLTEIKKDCESAEKLVTQQLALDKAATEAGDATNNIAKHPKTAVKAVQKLHDQLKTHPQEPVIRFELGEIQKKIDKAKAAVA